MQDNEDTPDPLAIMNGIMQARRDAYNAAEKRKSQNALVRDRIVQKLRLKLEAQLSDPMHPLTESNFALAMKGLLTGFDSAIEAADIPMGEARADVLRSIAELLAAAADDFAANPCDCPRCGVA